MADIQIMACCNTSPQCETIYGRPSANFCCPVCGRKSKPFAVKHEKGSYYSPINMKAMEDAIECWNHDVTESEGIKMEVSYKGITGELLKLERKENKVEVIDSSCCIMSKKTEIFHSYDLDIWNTETEAKISFSGVALKDVKFLGGEVTFG